MTASWVSMNWIREFVRRFLPKEPFARSVSVLAGGTAFSQVLAVLAAPALTRLYPAEAFGYLQIYMSFMAFAMLASTLRYEQAIFLPERDEIAANLVVVSLLVVGIISTFVAAVAWLVQHHRLLPGSTRGLWPYWWIFPIAVCGAGIYQSLCIWALRLKAFGRITGTKLTQVISMLSTQVGLGVFHSGPLGLLLGDAFGRMSGSAGLMQLSWHRTGAVFRAVRWSSMWRAAVRYRRFPLVSSGSALAGVAAFALPPLLIAQLYGPRPLGWFALGDRVLNAPAVLIGQAVSQVYSVQVSSLSITDPEALHALFFRSIKHLVVLGAIPFLILFFLAPPLFGFVFGEVWREAGVYARLLAVMHYLAFVSWPLTPTLNLLEQQFWQLAWDVGRLGLTLGSLWFSYHWGLSARGMIGALGAAIGAGYAAHLLLSHFAIKRRIRQFQARGSAGIAAPQYAELGKL